MPRPPPTPRTKCTSETLRGSRKAGERRKQREGKAKEAEREGDEGSAEAQRELRGEVVEEGEGVHENKSPPHRGGGIPPPV